MALEEYAKVDEDAMRIFTCGGKYSFGPLIVQEEYDDEMDAEWVVDDEV